MSKSIDLSRTSFTDAAILAEEQLDLTAPVNVDIQIREDKKVIWIHVNGITILRCCRIGTLTINGE